MKAKLASARHFINTSIHVRVQSSKCAMQGHLMPLNLWPNFQNKNIRNNFRKISNIFSTVLMLVEFVKYARFHYRYEQNIQRSRKVLLYMMEMSNVRTDF